MTEHRVLATTIPGKRGARTVVLVQCGRCGKEYRSSAKVAGLEERLRQRLALLPCTTE